jgi:hypothetical protein
VRFFKSVATGVATRYRAFSFFSMDAGFIPKRKQNRLGAKVAVISKPVFFSFVVCKGSIL